MGTVAGRVDAKPLSGVHELNKHPEPVRLFSGPVGGLRSSTNSETTIELTFKTGPRLSWRVKADPDDFPPDIDPFEMSFRKADQSWNLRAQCNEVHRGFFNSAEWSSGEPLQRVVANWINLPDIIGNETLYEQPWRWRGRLHFAAQGWDITIDGRRDHSDATKGSLYEPMYLLTHVMELRRSDGGQFSTDDARKVLEDLRIAFSFALGRWVAPALPVGFNSQDRNAWESWSAPIAGPMQRTGFPLLCHLQTDDVVRYLGLALTALSSDGRNGSLRFQMASAVQANESGFLEQRISTAFAAIENLSWTALVLSGRINRSQYQSKQWDGARRLREALALAPIKCNIDDFDLPALLSFSRRGRAGRIDGPAALVRVRNRLVHPKSPRDEVYHIPGLVFDSWSLSRYYLNLLILNFLGYDSRIQIQLPRAKSFGDTQLVPWASRT